MKLQLRFLIVLASIAIVMSAFLLMQRKFEIERSQTVLKSELVQHKKYMQNLVTLEGLSEKTFVEDYSPWDDLVSFVKHDNLEFAHVNLDVALSTFNSDADWVYRPNGTLLYFSSADGSKSLKSIALPQSFFNRLDSQKFTHFYRYVNDKLVEVRAATIVPSNDPKHNTPAKGYLVVGRVLNDSYIKGISNLTGNEVKIGNAQDTSDQTTINTVSFGEQFHDWDNKPVATLRATSDVPILSDLKQKYTRRLELIATFTIIASAIITALIWWLVLRPIRLIDRSIKSNQPKMLERLKAQKTEFGRLAQTVTDFFQQKVDLAQSEFKRDELERVNKEKASFLAVAAHHLNGPVANVKTFTEYLSFLLLHHANEDEVKKQLNRITNQSIRMSVIVGDLRAASAGNQKVEFNFKDFDFDAFLMEEVEEAKFTTTNKLEAKSDTQVHLHSDPDRLGQVLSNLIRNAKKYSPDGGDIIVRGTLQGDKVVVSVHDTGIGISSEDTQHLFEQFFRSESVREKFPGLGMDLYMSKNIIEALGGTIWVTSELGKGSIFYFSLPVKQPAPAPPSSNH